MINIGRAKGFNLIYILIFTLLFSLCLFKYPLSADTDTEQNFSYHFFSIVLAIVIVFLIPKSAESLKFLLYRNRIFSFLIFLLICLSLFDQQRFGFQNGHLTFIISFLLLLILFTTILTLKDCSRILIILVIFALIQVIISVFNYRSEVLNNYAGSTGIAPALSFKGTFTNSGPFSCFISILSPFVFYTLKNHLKRKYFISFYLIYLSATIGVIMITESRTAGIALIVAQCLIIYYAFGNRILASIRSHKYLIVTICLFGSGVLIFLLFKLKELSAYGRVLKYAVVGDKLLSSPVWGYGPGRFAFYYPQWQADYFKAHSASDNHFFLSAGDTVSAFNEYLELYIETGVIGLILCFVFIYKVFSSPKLKEAQPIVNAAKAVIISLLASCFTSYSLHCTAIVFVLLIALVILIGAESDRRVPAAYQSRILNFGLVYTLKIALVITFCYAVYNSISVMNWAKATDKESKFTNAEKVRIFGEEYPRLKYNGKFLSDYGQLLFDNQQCNKAIFILEESRKYFTSNATISSLALAYECVNNNQKALEYYRFQSFYIPSMFYPKYKMVLLNLKLGNKTEAKRIAGIILKMPVKIPGQNVELIKETARNVLKEKQVEIIH